MMIRTWISLTSSYQVKSKPLLSVCPSFAMWHQNSRCSIDWLSLMIDCVDNKWAVSLKEINERCIVITAHSKGALTICMETWKFQGEFKWNGLSRWKFSSKKVIHFEVLPFSLSYRNDRNFLYHLFGLPVRGFMLRESETFNRIL